MLFSLWGFNLVVKWSVKVREGTSHGCCSALIILKVLYGFCSLMFRWCILSHMVVYFKTVQFSKWWNVFCMTPQFWINSSSRKTKQQIPHRTMSSYLSNFEQNILFGLFKCMNYHLNMKYVLFRTEMRL